jgi:hypothetical protein
VSLLSLRNLRLKTRVIKIQAGSGNHFGRHVENYITIPLARDFSNGLLAIFARDHSGFHASLSARGNGHASGGFVLENRGLALAKDAGRGENLCRSFHFDQLGSLSE